MGNILAGKGINRSGKRMIRDAYGSKRASIKKKKNYSARFFSFEIQKYYLNERRFNAVYSRDSLLDKIKKEAYLIGFDDYSNTGTHWIALYALDDDITD